MTLPRKLRRRSLRRGAALREEEPARARGIDRLPGHPREPRRNRRFAGLAFGVGAGLALVGRHEALVAGEWCGARHVGVVVSGAWGAELRDGTILEFGPDDVYDVPPGHDSYTIGDEPCVLIEWMGMRALAGRQREHQDRVLTTLLFTDIVESTTTLVEAGDAGLARASRVALRGGEVGARALRRA